MLSDTITKAVNSAMRSLPETRVTVCLGGVDLEAIRLTEVAQSRDYAKNGSFPEAMRLVMNVHQGEKTLPHVETGMAVVVAESLRIVTSAKVDPVGATCTLGVSPVLDTFAQMTVHHDTTPPPPKTFIVRCSPPAMMDPEAQNIGRTTQGERWQILVPVSELGKHADLVRIGTTLTFEFGLFPSLKVRTIPRDIPGCKVLECAANDKGRAFHD